MEPDGENRSQFGPKVVDLDVEFEDLDVEFEKLMEFSPPEDPDEQEYMEHVAFWEAILGVHPMFRTADNVDNVSECYRSLVDNALKNDAKYQKELNDYSKRISELNDANSDNLYTHVEILPRSPTPRCFHLWHRDFRMTNTNPTLVGSMRFTQPGAYEYVASELLQFFSMRFVGDFLHGQKMSIYGFVAVRDEVDKLRNYIYNRSREHAQEITPESPDLLLIPPTRGISACYDVIVEYSLKVKGNSGDVTKDKELIDGCFMFMERLGYEITCRKVRLFGPLGPFDIRFVFLRFAVEATIEVKVKRAMPGYSLSRVTVSTCGHSDEITLYDRSAPCPAPMALKDGGDGLSSVVAVEHAVVAVELGCDLKLQFEISREEKECESGIGRHARKSSHELLFTAERYRSSKGAIIMGRMFKVKAKVTWSTMGTRFLPIFDSRKSGLLGPSDGRCLT